LASYLTLDSLSFFWGEREYYYFPKVTNRTHFRASCSSTDNSNPQSSTGAKTALLFVNRVNQGSLTEG